MPKKEQIVKKSLIEKFGFLFISLILVILVYGGLNIFKLQKENQILATKQTALENKIITLEGQIIDNQNDLAKVNQDLENTTNKLQKNTNELAYYKNMALDLKTAAEQTSQTQLAVDQEIKLEPAKTVIQKVYVKAKPKYEASVVVEGVGKFKVAVQAGDTAYSVLKKASDQNGFALKTTDWGGDLGISIDGIGGINPTLAEHKFWAFYYNNTFSQVGVSSQKINSDDIVYFMLSSW